jgi:hypothetical protein
MAMYYFLGISINGAKYPWEYLERQLADMCPNPEASRTEIRHCQLTKVFCGYTKLGSHL